MGQVGFGAYRVSKRSKEHKEALIKALVSGCQLLDTSSNYTNGESEELIGEVLKENPTFKPKIITKAGYIQGLNLEALSTLNEKGLALENVVTINENLKHSIHPEFLEHQLNQSLTRLGVESIDFYLIHNPEYYFKEKNSNQDEYYKRIEKAFIFLEDQVRLKKIKNYGISSNHFILPIEDPEVTNLAKVLELTKKNNLHFFKMIQFPFNLIEIGALEKQGDFADKSLLETAQDNDLLTVINRPLNAFTQNKLVRLATYDNELLKINDSQFLNDFNQAIELLRLKWNESVDENVTTEDFYQTELMKQFRDLWNNLPTPDAVEQVYFGHFFPFVAKLWGRDLSPEEAAPFFKLLENSLLYSRVHMTNKALEFKKQAVGLGLLPDQKDVAFSVMAIETYLDYGFDYVLVGMKKVEYVDQLKHLF